MIAFHVNVDYLLKVKGVACYQSLLGNEKRYCFFIEADEGDRLMIVKHTTDYPYDTVEFVPRACALDVLRRHWRADIRYTAPIEQVLAALRIGFDTLGPTFRFRLVHSDLRSTLMDILTDVAPPIPETSHAGGKS